MNDMDRAFFKPKRFSSSKWEHYFLIYHRHFSRWRWRPVVVLEIGVDRGGSLELWREYFGDQSTILGADINPRVTEREFSFPVKIFKVDADKISDLERLRDAIPRLDIVIDDGGHKMQQQINALNILLPHLSENGVYLCEDTKTSYWFDYDGGLRKPGTFIEYSKELIDGLNEQWTSQDIPNFNQSVMSMTFYSGVVVFDKGKWNTNSLVKSPVL